MESRGRALIVAALAVGCSRSAEPAPRAAASAIAVAAGPEAIVARDGAVVARAVATGVERDLFRGPVVLASFDAALELLWVQGPTTLDVVDLRSNGAPVRVVEGLPDAAPITIDASALHRGTVGGSSCITVKDVVLKWSAAPAIELFTTDAEEKARFDASAKLVGARWLSGQVGRAANAGTPPRRELSAKSLRKVATLPCEGQDRCGESVQLDDGTWLVLTDAALEDCLHLACRVFDPKTLRFATPPGRRWGALEATKAGSCGPYAASPDGHVLGEDSVCDAAGACSSLAGRGLGWLGPQRRFGLAR